MKGYKHTTKEQQTEVLRLHAIPIPTAEIARLVGISAQQVRYTIHKAGVPLSHSKGGACYQNVDLIRQLAAEGSSLAEIGRRIGTTRRLVRLFLRRHDIPYERFRQVGENNPAWKGGRMKDKAGYILIHMPEHPDADRHGYVREHRIVMEKILGRSLLPEEVVHHKDEDPENNAPDNLQLYSSNGEHLAETLKGRRPNWSEPGLQQVLEACRRGRETLQKSNRST